MKWKRVSEKRYWYMLEVIFPAVMTGTGFLVGEPWDHGTCTVTGKVAPRFTAFVEIKGRFYEALAPMTVAEFNQVTVGSVMKGTAA